ncbi:NmrA family transcriptional regulator [Streptomyces sp. NBC_01498]|uniref:NmrA family NAD(P)-binding protein n=1 Tax=Streptomyces sp. NBC_01498 TaxID=2975870 RepID=UPI002E7AD148|nr:NmrA family transcriptional regulator [Streptomyces sp. NBC_01498]WTL28454.1 NmrA family transcriptional regulator [Streptomyces sp. NBC_01498]
MTQTTHHTRATEPGLTLVTGGTGKTGRRVARSLGERGVPVRVGSRSGEIPFVWEDPGTWDAALDGVGAIYLCYFPDLAFPGAAETVGAFADRAVAGGARRVVLLSGRGEEGARTAEDRVRASGADLTVVRASWFSQNFDEGLFLDPVLGGELALPTGDAVEPFVDVDDVADVAVAALTDDRHIGRTYELSGPRLLGFAEIAAELTEATGREIAYTPVSLDTYRHFLSEMGAQEDFADLFELINDGRNAHLVHGVEEALGRGPRDFTDFATRAARAGVWDPAPGM